MIADYDQVIKHYDPEKLVKGKNVMPDGEEIYYIQNPAVGLWAEKGRFKSI